MAWLTRRDLRRRQPEPAGRLPDARHGGPEVALDVDGEGLERRDVEHAAPFFLRWRWFEHQAIQAPEKRGERLAASGRRQDECGFATGDCRPSQLLRFRQRGERAGKPFADRRVKSFHGLSYSVTYSL